MSKVDLDLSGLKASKLKSNIVFVIDESTSMMHLKSKTIEVFTSMVKSLINQQTTADQDIKLSLYTFSSLVKQHYLMEDLNNVKNGFNYFPSGCTALYDAIFTSIDDHKIAVGKGESVLIYVITDGDENVSKKSGHELKNLISNMSDGYTLAALVPNASGAHRMKTMGLHAGNIEVWDATSVKGMEELGNRVMETSVAYTTMRSTGVKSTTRLFVDAKSISTNNVKSTLNKMDNAKSYFVREEGAIKYVVEKLTGKPYQIGKSYYELSKPETIQASKQIIVMRKSKSDYSKYTGPQARAMLGLPSGEIKVKPGDFGDWRIFVQSTSVNRKVLKDSSIIVVD